MKADVNADESKMRSIEIPRDEKIKRRFSVRLETPKTVKDLIGGYSCLLY